MDEHDGSVACEPNVRPREAEEPMRLLRTAFLDHLRSGHGVLTMPDDEVKTWWLHQQLHGR
jgi:hypothetical protein